VAWTVFPLVPRYKTAANVGVMRKYNMKNHSLLANTFAIISILLLTPALLAFIGIYSSFYEIIAPIIETNSGNATEIAQSVSITLVNQQVLVIAVIPAIVVISLLIFKVKYYESWYVKFLKISSWLMIFTLPFFLFIGFLLLFLSSRAKKNA
tara:strand:+ start:1971 stop:2426 length:456 start_codon:yes stop_codon:yes gene_type:complete